MILPINTNPSIISYAHHAYTLAIMERANHDSLVSICLNVKSELFTEQVENDVEFIKQDFRMEIRDRKYAQNTECFALMECAEEEDIWLEVTESRTDICGGILNLIIVAENYLEAACNNRDIFRIGILGGGGLLCSKNSEYKDIPMRWAENLKCKKIRMSRNRNLITYWAMSESGWIEVYKTELPEHLRESKLYIGINGNWGEMQLQNWKYMNYLQLSYSEKDDSVWLDYFLYPRKNFSFNHTQQFLDIVHIPQDEFLDIFKSIPNGLAWYINHGYYVELTLDEYYIEERRTTGKKQYFHNNLFYGYSQDKSLFYALGYKDKVQTAKVNSEILDKCIKMDSVIKAYRYVPNNLGMQFDMKRFIRLLEQFVAGESSGMDFCNILAVDEYSYGLEVFEAILRSKKGQRVLQRDERVTYLLYEHGRLMQERLDFFVHRNYLSKEEYTELNALCSEMVHDIEVLKNLVLKNQVKEVYNEAILRRMEQLYSMEKKFHMEFLRVLKGKASTVKQV